MNNRSIGIVIMILVFGTLFGTLIGELLGWVLPDSVVREFFLKVYILTWAELLAMRQV